MMPRFLTPPRIGLLLLAEVYMTSDRDEIDHHGAAGILEFIAKHTTLTVEHDPRLVDEKQSVLASDVSALRSHLQPLALVFPRLDGPFTGTAWDAFLIHCWRATLNGHQDLQDLLTRMRASDPRIQSPFSRPGAPANPPLPRPVTPGSPLGQFIRRCHIEFTRLQFHDIHALWKSFEAWRASSWENLTKIAPRLARHIEEERVRRHQDSITSSYKRGDFSTAQGNTAAAFDADMLLTHAIRQLQQLGTRVPEDVKTQLSRWVIELSASSAGTQSMHFFMAFFEHSKAGQYTMALESLHRYFDYSLAAKNGTADSTNLKIYYQYALLHLSVLHADFECWEESVDAMNECIATARENQDAACLNFALQWLLYLQHAHPGKGTEAYASISGVVGGGEHDEIAFLKTKARESKNWLLMSSTLLEESRLELSSGGSANHAQEHVLQAKYLSMQHDLKTLAPATHLLYGSCLERLGQAHTAHRHCELATTVLDAHCPINDRVRARCRSASALAQQGSYTKALSSLDELAPTVKDILKSHTRVQASSALICLRRSIHRGKHEHSLYYLNQLLPIVSAADPEVSHDFHALQVEHMITQKHFPEALAKVSARLTAVVTTGGTADLAQRLFWLISKARIFTEAGRAAKGFSICLRATSTAERHLLVPIMLEGLAVLGRILIDVGEFEAAKDLYESALPVAVGGSSSVLTARMWVGLGESCVGLAGKAQQPHSSEYAVGNMARTGEQARLMRRARECLHRGNIVYQKLEDREGQIACLTMASRILHWSSEDGALRQAEEMIAALVTARRQDDDDD